MGLSDILPNPLDFTNSKSNSDNSFLPGLPGLNIDLTNPLDSLLAGKNNSGPSSGDRSGGPLDLFGSLTLTNPFELTKNILNKPLDIAESILGGDPGGVLQLGRQLHNAPFDQAEAIVDNVFGGDQVSDRYWDGDRNTDRNEGLHGRGDSSDPDGSFLDILFGEGSIMDLFGGGGDGGDRPPVPHDVWSPPADGAWAPFEEMPLDSKLYDPAITTGDGADGIRSMSLDQISPRALVPVVRALNQIIDLLKQHLPDQASELSAGGGGSAPCPHHCPDE